MRTTVLLPETLLAAGALGLLLAGRLRPRLSPDRTPVRRGRGPVSYLSVSTLSAPALLATVALAVVLAALAVELWLGAQVGTLFAGGWVQDRFSVFAKASLLVGLAALVASSDWRARQLPEVLTLGMLSVFGGMVAASASSLLGLWAGLELAALAGVAAVGLAARDTGLRVLVVSAFAGGLVAVGFGFLYALVGASTLSGVRQALITQPVTLPLALVLLLTLAGAAIRLGLAPFQAPWVEGGIGVSPPGAAILNGLVGGAAALVLAKLLGALVGANAGWAMWMSVLAALAVVLGGLRATAVASPRGVAAWLVVQQTGWVAAGLATHDRRGSGAALFLIGALVIAATTAPLLAGPARAGPVEVAGLARREPARAAALGLVLLSLAGVPPLAGFFGEFTVAVELVRSNLGWLLGCGLLGSVLATIGVVRVLRVMYVEPSPEDVRGGGPRRAALWSPGPFVPAVMVLTYGLFANPIHNLAVQGAAALGLH